MTQPTQVTAEQLRRMALPQPEEGSKDARGQVLIVAGSVEVPGAALLAATAALRAGAGKLQIATVKSIAPALGLAVPEALVTGLPETSDGGIRQDAGERLLRKAKRSDAVLIGPGMTEEDATGVLTAGLLKGALPASLVLDAASLVGLRPQAEAARGCEGRLVITPHAGEMAKLLDKSRDDIEAAPLDAALAAARLLGAVVVMKGARTHVVDPDGEAWIYAGGGVGLATSGSGDVLAGIIVGLLARKATPVQAALWGVFLHGEAGSRLAKSVGPLGFLARELAGEVPLILARVESGS